jgi:uncharacterized protein YprB with RNaseH-like and TPR domain
MNSNNLDDKLARLKRFIVSPDTSSQESGDSAASIPSRYERLVEAVNGRLVACHAGYYCLVSRLYPFGAQFGDFALNAPSVSQVGLDAFSADGCPDVANLGDLVFFDTETTGLGGSGTVAFLIGCGSLTADGFEVRQYLLQDYSDEAALLEKVLEELSAEKTLVTYNGAAFDLPVVRDRFIINRVARAIPASGHIDLLHAARRLYRRRLGDCSLTNVERELLGFHRTDDIPGYLVPSVYFDWLSEESTELLDGVLEHNRQDIVSLYLLLSRIHEAFETRGATLDAAEDLHSLSRVFVRRKRHDVAVAIGDRAADATGTLAPDMILFHSMALKRSGQTEAAVALWQQLTVEDSREGFLASLEMAKHCEHRTRDISAALQYAQRARALLPESRAVRDDLRRRLKRLERKLKNSG